jgi:hypothetical protein
MVVVLSMPLLPGEQAVSLNLGEAASRHLAPDR